ncbi:MAG: di-heme oxidoredictase family protein [Thermodesulfobacteriota bacterium]
MSGVVPNRAVAGARRTGAACLLGLALLGASACADAPAAREPVPVPVDPAERFPGGDVTVARDDDKAFSQGAPGLDFRGEANFKSGNLLFRGSPAGLGPLFNTQSCQGCHNQDGRGSAPASPDEPMVSMLLKIGVDAGAGMAPDPIYGDQLQTFGVERGGPSGGLPRHDGALPRDDSPLGDGAIGEGYAFIELEEVHGAYPDGDAFVLHRPTYKIRDLSYGPLADGIAWSPRVAPGMIGLGLLEAIPESDLLALADPDDADGDGISGRPNFARDVLRDQIVLGRFGVKASQPSILQQAAAAYLGDIGVTTSVFRAGPCTDAQAACLARATDPAEGPEIADVQLALVEFYARHLAVPERRGWDASAGTWEPPVGRGRDAFHEAGCSGCHVPSHRTGTAAGSLLGDVNLFELVQPATPLAALSGQQIWPYTDLLLHDMGGGCGATARETAEGAPCEGGAECLHVRRCEGLADGFPDGEASGTEWRTPPLWGLGLVRLVNPRAGYLHDGRARSVEEAILWHDGEARGARERFMALSREDRAALLAFLDSM